MPMTSVRCPVLGAHVTRLTDLEGSVTRIICAEYVESGGSCRVKTAALDGGPLARLLERMSEDALDTRSTLCVMRAQ
jgi:hypothetical protein